MSLQNSSLQLYSTIVGVGALKLLFLHDLIENERGGGFRTPSAAQ